MRFCDLISSDIASQQVSILVSMCYITHSQPPIGLTVARTTHQASQSSGQLSERRPAGSTQGTTNSEAQIVVGQEKSLEH